MTGDREVDDREYELKQLMEGERFTPLFKVGSFCWHHLGRHARCKGDMTRLGDFLRLR